MKSPMRSMEWYFANIPGWVRKRRALVWVFLIAVTVLMVIGIGRIQFDTSIQGWLEKDARPKPAGGSVSWPRALADISTRGRSL